MISQVKHKLPFGFFPFQWINDDELLCFRHARIYCFSVSNGKVLWNSSLPCAFSVHFLSLFRLISRALRLFPRGSAINKEKSLVEFAFKGFVYSLDLLTKKIKKDFSLPNGSRSPLNIAFFHDFPWIDDGFIFGEYFGNPEKNEVRIFYKRNKIGESWRSIFAFVKGDVRHIHLVLPDEKEKNFFVFTGDDGDEVKIVVISSLIEKPWILCRSNQSFRSCAASFVGGRLVYATDSPFEQNFLFSLYHDSQKAEVVPLCRIEGSVISFCDCDGSFAFSTCVESNLKKDENDCNQVIRIDGKHGGILSKNSFLYFFDGRNIHLVDRAKKDPLSIHYFGFGSFCIAQGPSSNLAYYSIGLFPVLRPAYFILCGEILK